MIKKVILLVGMFATLSTSSCIKKDCQFGGAYQFEIPMTLSPAKEIYKIGDTISINSQFSDQVYEAVTDQFYSLMEFKFYPAFDINEISDSIRDQTALNNFEVIIDTVKYDFIEYVYSSGAVTYDGEYLYKDGEYSLEYKLIPKATGLYIFGQDSQTDFLNENQGFPGKCNNKAINVRTILNNRTSNNNIHLAKDSPIHHYNTRIFQNPEERFTYFGAFVFYVEE